jgi:curved DNA-binding protein CbpA
MPIKKLALKELEINRANDRHGELENETAAIAWLFHAREAHMRALAKDIVERREIYELPLVSPEGNRFVVYDGNRRITCLKLLADPKRAPTAELQTFFSEQKAKLDGKALDIIECQVEQDRERIDEILFRRHTGSQNGIGQSTWDDRMKATFVARTGKGSGISVADEIENRLEAADMLPTRRKIPRSIMNRLLSAEPFRNRLGFTLAKGRFTYTHDEDVVLKAMARVADDLANRRKVLGDFWDVDGKRAYLDELEHEGALPTAKDALSRKQSATPAASPRVKPGAAPRPTQRLNLIPQKEYGIAWPGRLQRQHQIWEELQFHLELKRHPNAISVLFRVLLELTVENYAQQSGIVFPDKEKLANRVKKAGEHLQANGKLNQKQVTMLHKFQHSDQLVSSDTLNRYVHSANFAPSPEHLASLWDSLGDFIVLCLKA